MTTAKNKNPSSQFARYIGPVLQAIRELGGSGRPDEVRAAIAHDLGISDAEQSEALPSGVQTRFESQVHWARFYLAKAGYIDSSQRGVWTLTGKGRALGTVTPEEIQKIIREVSTQTKSAGRRRHGGRSIGQHRADRQQLQGRTWSDVAIPPGRRV